MYCTQCGFEVEDSHQFCARCGVSVDTGQPAGRQASSRLSRPMEQKKIAGVCAGFARYFGVDVTLMRVLWLAVAILSGGLGVIVYLAAWLVMPKDYPAAAHGYRVVEQQP
jgi:phage shock protein C